MHKVGGIEDLKHGMRVRCKIKGRQVDDARISIDEARYGDVYICQDVVPGTNGASEMFGYDNAWLIGDKGRFRHVFSWDRVTDFEIVEGLRAAKAGDILVDGDGDECRVIDVLPNSILISYYHDHVRARSWYTFEELEDLGYEIEEYREVGDLRDLKAGDVLVDEDGYENVVTHVLLDSVFLSSSRAYSCFSFNELRDRGYKIKRTSRSRTKRNHRNSREEIRQKGV